MNVLCSTIAAKTYLCLPTLYYTSDIQKRMWLWQTVAVYISCKYDYFLNGNILVWEYCDRY